MTERIIFFGRNKHYNITHLCFRLLVQHLIHTRHNIVLTVVSDDNHGDTESLEKYSETSGIPWLSAPSNDVNDSAFISILRKLEPTMFLTVQFPRIFKPVLFSLPARASLNIHRGWPLRGGAIDERAIFHRLPVYNVILHHMCEGIDTGNIIAKKGFPVDGNEDGYSLENKVYDACHDLFINHLLNLIGNKIPPGENQNLEETRYAGKESLGNIIDFRKSGDSIERLCRAFHHPRKKGAVIKVADQDVFVIPPVVLAPQSFRDAPGRILDIRDTSVIIAAADACVSINTCHKGDRNTILFTEILREKGYKTGDILGF